MAGNSNKTKVEPQQLSSNLYNTQNLKTSFDFLHPTNAKLSSQQFTMKNYQT